MPRLGRLRLALLATLAVAALGGCHTIQTSSDYYGIDTSGVRSVVFLVDISGSMEGKQEGTIRDAAQAEVADRAGTEVQRRVGGTLGRALGRGIRRQGTKLAGVKRELVPALRGLPETTQFTVVAFDDQPSGWERELVPANATNRTAAAAYVERLASDGGTGISGALDYGLRLRPQIIFLMTDGQPSDGSPQAIRDAVRERWNADGATVIHTIGVGPDQDEQFLDDLARENGGDYVRKR